MFYVILVQSKQFFIIIKKNYANVVGVVNVFFVFFIVT